ncbi:MAG: DUF1836 domain-containing protein [Eubacteriales bacterium]|nr:DUF1836 domain-containing protein [Eubacteriales bacterium]MDD4422610.1 DUF1836 domain-containing protein [Eubacteriales bacterium]HBR31577.1 hypothetical protein [Clostridiales bacterium]
MKSVKGIKEKLRTTKPVIWEQLPDIELYKDQIIAYMQRQLISYDDNELLTGAMINNYIKAGALPRPNGKKYGREHIALLTAICALKPIMSVSDMEYLLKSQNENIDTESFYGLLCADIEKTMQTTADNIDDNLEEDNLPRYIVSIALQAAGLRLVCESLLRLLREENAEKERVKKEKSSSKKDKKENKDDKK